MAFGSVDKVPVQSCCEGEGHVHVKSLKTDVAAENPGALYVGSRRGQGQAMPENRELLRGVESSQHKGASCRRFEQKVTVVLLPQKV